MISAHVGRAAALLDGELPPEIAQDVASTGLDLSPGGRGGRAAVHLALNTPMGSTLTVGTGAAGCPDCNSWKMPANSTGGLLDAAAGIGNDVTSG